jgi:hypothetical protein
VTPKTPKIRDTIRTVADLDAAALASCEAGDVKATKRALKAMLKKAGRIRKLLASKQSQAIPGRDELLATAKSVKTDVKTLRGSLVCPPPAALIE